jgi:NADH:ubiquinone oxidoreductase subunit 2 (subunit N)
VYAMYFDEAATPVVREPLRVPFSATVGIVAALAFTLFAGVYPGWLLDLARHAHLT